MLEARIVARYRGRTAMKRLATVGLTVIGVWWCGHPAWADEAVFPDRSWQERSPAEVGMNVGKLEELRRYAGGLGCVVRHGYMVYTWGDATKRMDVASACKPWYTHFLLKAIEDGKVPGVDEKIIRWEPRLKGLNAKRGYKDRQITWRHLANQVSCYGVEERPGEAYDYSDYNMALFFDTLFLKVYGSSWKTVDDQVLPPLLTDKIGCQDNPTFMAFGTGNRPGRVGVSARDFARFGLLYLRGGKWNGQQLIDPEHVKLATTTPLGNSIPRTTGRSAEMIPGQRSIGGGNNQTDHLGSYSFAWWTNGTDRDGRRHWPDVPTDTFGAFGHGGKRAMVVLPVLDLIVCWNDSKINGREMENRALRLAVEACRAKPRKVGHVSNVPVVLETSARWNRAPRGIQLAGTAILVADRRPKDIGRLSQCARWATLEIALQGPDCQSRGKPNPFGILVDAVFTGPGNRRFKVPGFYEGDGRGGPDGNVWKVRFSPDAPGKWIVATQSPNELLDNYRGVFLVTDPSEDAPGFYRWGRLGAVGTAADGIRYLKFRDGPYWLKAGCDDPENFLGRFRNYDTPEKRRSTVDYLAAKGINSMYMMTHNIGGDDNDVWPWLGNTPKEAKSYATADVRFDIARLAEWRALFEYMQSKGVVPYLVLEDDSAWHGYDHARYYREMIARFGDLPAVMFNVNEEHNEHYKLAEALDFMRQLEAIDPYGHPRGIHNVNRPSDPYVDASQVDFTSIQTTGSDPLAHNALAIEWIERCRRRGKRVLMVGFDEGRPEEDRRAWWSAYLGGGVWEAHVRKPYDRPMKAWGTLWTELGGTRAFMESLPFWEMEPRNDLVTAGNAFCLAAPGQAYALYLPQGGTVIVQLAPNAEYTAAWWNPTNSRNGRFQDPTRISGGRQQFPAPTNADWALRILRAQRIRR